MSITYSEAAKTKTSEAVYARGIKYYLYQKIKSQQDLLLPFWRIYEVKGEHENYFVRFPIAHKLTQISTLDKLANILETHASCNCPYAIEYGICKHIVAVCSDVDNEFFEPQKDFKLKNDAKEIGKLQNISILENIFGIEQVKKQAQFLNYLFKLNTPSYLTREMVLEIEKETQLVSDLAGKLIVDHGFQNGLEMLIEEFGQKPDTFTLINKILEKIEPKLGFYKEEKDIFILIEKTVYFWQNPSFLYLAIFWMPHISIINSSKIIYLLFKLSFTILENSRWAKTFVEYLGSGSLSQELIQAVIDSLEQDFGGDAPITAAFAIQTRFTAFLDKNLETLQNPVLLNIIDILPDSHEQIDQILRDRARAWVDYLPTNTQSYTELSTFLHTWATNLGSSEYLQEVLSHVQQIHHKKKALLALLEDLK